MVEQKISPENGMLMELFFESLDTCVNYFACHSIGRGGGAHEKSQDKVIKICHSLLYNTILSKPSPLLIYSSEVK